MGIPEQLAQVKEKAPLPAGLVGDETMQIDNISVYIYLYKYIFIYIYILYVYVYEYQTKLGMTKVVLRGSCGWHHCKTDRGPP